MKRIKEVFIYFVKLFGVSLFTVIPGMIFALLLGLVYKLILMYAR